MPRIIFLSDSIFMDEAEAISYLKTRGLHQLRANGIKEECREGCDQEEIEEHY